jgi:hypothetical protein
MLRTLFLVGIITIVACTLFGALLGVAGAVLWFALKVVLLGGVVYFVIRLISPTTAARLRNKFESHSLPRL